MSASKREHLVSTALRLFNENGYTATGIDTILAEARVSKRTLYNHFKSKDELILAALQLREQEFNEWFGKTHARHTRERDGDPYAPVRAIFDTLGEWFAGDSFRGCNFIHASGEFSNANDPVLRFAGAHKRSLGRVVRGIVAAYRPEDPDQLTDELQLLVEGSIVMAHVMARRDISAEAGEAAVKLVRAAVGAGSELAAPA